MLVTMAGAIRPFGRAIAANDRHHPTTQPCGSKDRSSGSALLSTSRYATKPGAPEHHEIGGPCARSSLLELLFI